MFLRILLSLFLIMSFGSCISSYTRLPSSVAQIYSNDDLQQSLMLIAQNNILIHIPDETTREFEKTIIDQKCRQIEKPFWSDKLSKYLKELNKRPELLTKFHVIEMKRADKTEITIQKDLDGAVTLSIQFIKLEEYEKITGKSKIPCGNSLVEYLGRDMIKTHYEFPSLDKFVLAAQNLPEKKEMPRFKFSNEFLNYLAERGVIFKFSHDMSFEKNSKGQYVMVDLLNKLSSDIKQPFHQHINYWFKQINTQSTQAQLIQMFGAFQDKELKAGVRVDLKSELAQKVYEEPDLTYLFISYNVDHDELNLVNLQQLEKCLESFTQSMGGIKFRKPAATEDKDSYLRPGYTCAVPPALKTDTVGGVN